MAQHSIHQCDGCQAELEQSGPLPSPYSGYLGPPGWAKLSIVQPVPGVPIATYDFCPRCTSRMVTLFALPRPDPAPQPPWLKPVS